MHPLHRIAWGFLVVLADLRFESFDSFDVIPDVLGWVLVLAGLLRLAGQHAGYRIATVAAAASLVAALLTEYVFGLGARQTGVAGLWGALDSVLGAVFVFGTCTALRAAASRAGDSATATGADVVRWLDLALTVGGLAASAAAGFPAEPVQVSGEALPVMLVGLALAAVVVVWFLVLLFRGGRQGYGVPAAAATP